MHLNRVVILSNYLGRTGGIKSILIHLSLFDLKYEPRNHIVITASGLTAAASVKPRKKSEQRNIEL